VRQNAPFQDTKKSKKFLGRGHSPYPDPSPVGRGTPLPTPLDAAPPNENPAYATDMYTGLRPNPKDQDTDDLS